MEQTNEITQETTPTAARPVDRLRKNLELIIKGKSAQVEFVITSLIAGGHVLMEDNPGTGKTVLAKTLAASIGGGASFKRVQFTPDLLPMDLLVYWQALLAYGLPLVMSWLGPFYAQYLA